MQIAPVIAYHNLDPSPAVEAIVERRTQKLERLFDRIIGCEVSLEALERRKRHGRTLRAHLVVHLPGPDVSVDRTVAQGSAQEDLMLAVNRAFSAAEKLLKRHKKVMAGLEVKPHPPVLHGQIAVLEPELGHGWLRADDGREVYFQKDALTGGDWDRLKVGARLRFREAQGEKGPYATGVTPVA